MPQPRVIVVGAGVGGLSAALTLAARGLEVRVFERAARPGGKMREVPVAGRQIDGGPTVFTMRWVFDELFDQIGESLEAHLTLEPVDILARHAWSGGERLDLFADLDRSAAAIGEFAGARAARGYRDFCKRAGEIFAALDKSFMRAPEPSMTGLIRGAGLGGLGSLARISPFTTMWRELGKYFADQRLRQLFARYATYCGASPFEAPATLMLVAHVEQAGVWTVAGGMHRVAAVLAERASAHGATIGYDTHVAGLTHRAGRIAGVRLDNGEELDADAVIFNGDADALAAGLLGEAARAAVSIPKAARRSQSALTWTVVAQAEGFPLIRHNVFFGGDYAAEFESVFQHERLPHDPTVYVCAQDRDDDGVARTDAGERLLCLVNAPAVSARQAVGGEEIETCRQAAFSRMAACGLRLDHAPGAISHTDPAGFAELFPGSAGALYGRAPHGWRASFARPGTRSAIPGLYLAGGSVHPGPGVPMAALSGRMAAASLVSDLAST